jgi:mersacidin/lichenicidin family type 2 lantibiotic
MGNIRTGKDADHRQSLNEAARAARPATPAGALVLTEEDLGAVVGGLRGSPHNPLREQRLPQGRHPPLLPTTAHGPMLDGECSPSRRSRRWSRCAHPGRAPDSGKKGDVPCRVSTLRRSRNTSPDLG